MLRFEWDREKAAKNQAKHGVAFNEAATALADPLSTTFPDPDHSILEDRFVTIGTADTGRLLVVIHTGRPGAIRIISARKATRRERKFYEDGP
ncbi:MAG: BrnT family toxin [Planctomycetes bacterium]|nr:BrnT family toxin [Planctomycetota bacterium]